MQTNKQMDRKTDGMDQEFSLVPGGVKSCVVLKCLLSLWRLTKQANTVLLMPLSGKITEQAESFFSSKFV